MSWKARETHIQPLSHSLNSLSHLLPIRYKTWKSDNSPELTRSCVQISSYSLAHQFVLEACDFPANVLLRSGLHKQPPLVVAKAIHSAGAAVSISHQEFQFSSFFQINICSCRVFEGLYANSQVFVRGRWNIGSQVDYEGSRGVHPLYGPFGTAEVDLFNILPVRLVGQATGRRKKQKVREMTTSNLAKNTQQEMQEAQDSAGCWPVQLSTTGLLQHTSALILWDNFKSSPRRKRQTTSNRLQN